MKITKNIRLEKYGVQGNGTDDVIIKSIDRQQGIVTCDLTKGSEEANNYEVLATDRYFHYRDGSRKKNIPFADLTAKDKRDIETDELSGAEL